MLVIKIEFWNHGDPLQKEIIGEGRIINDRSGNFEEGNYRYEFRSSFFNKELELWKKGEVKKFPRLNLNAWQLIKCCLNEKG